MDDIVASAQVVLEGVDKVSPAATSSIAALRQLAAAGEDVQRKLINAAQKHQDTLKALNQIYAQNQQAAQAAGTATVQAHNTVTQAVQAQTQAAKNVSPVLNAAQTAANQLQKQLRDAFSVVGIEEFIRKSYMAFTSQEEEMRRVQLAAGGTAEEIKQLHKELQDLASTTGQTTEALAKGFRDFQAGSGLSGGELKAAFRGVVEAADMAGIHVVEMSRIATTAMAQLHISTQEMPQLMGALGKAFAGMGSEAVHVLPNVINMMQQLNIRGRGALEGTVATIAALGKAIGDTGQAAQGYAAILDLIRRPGTTLGNRLSDKAQAAFEGGLNDVDLFVAAMDKVEEVRKRHEGDYRGTQMELELLFDGNQAAIQMSTNYMKLNEEERKKYIEDRRKQLATAKEIDAAEADFIRGSIEGTRKLVGEWNNLQNATGGFLDSLGATGTLQSTVEEIRHLRELLEWLDAWFKAHGMGGSEGGAQAFGGLGAKAVEHFKNVLPNMFSLGQPAPPHMAAGGVVTEPTMAMIGEAGPEAVVPVGGMAGADGGTQAERDAAEMWGRLHGLAGTRYKHVSLTGQLTQEELDKLLQAGMAGGGGPGGGGGGGGDRGWGPGSGTSSSDSDTPKDGKPGDPKAGGPGAGGPKGPVDKDGNPLFPTPPQHPGGAAGIPGLPGSPSGPALTHEERIAASQPQAPAAAGGPAVTSPYLVKERAWIREELDNDPKLRRFLAGVITHEQDPGHRAEVFESMANRLNFLRSHGQPNLTVKEYLSRTGRNQFYKPVRDGKINESYLRSAVDPYRGSKGIDAEIDEVLQGGSNRIKGFTDQGSKGDPNFGVGETLMLNKEGYNDFGGRGAQGPARAYRETQQQRMREYDAAHPGGATPATAGAPAGTLTSIEQVAGAPGGPSGPTLTHEQRIALGTGGSSEAGGGGGGPGEASVISPFPKTTNFRIGSGNVYGAGRSGGGRAHSGNDLHGGPNGSPVNSMTGGTVLYNGRNQGYGANLVIQGDDGVIRRYATHASTENLKPGARVQQGQLIGRIGEGHVHYEEIPPTINGRPNSVYRQFQQNAKTNTFTSTSNQRGTVDPSGPQGSLQNIGKKTEQAVQQAQSPDPVTRAEGRRQLVFLHGMKYGRFGNPAEVRSGIDADMQRVAAANDQELHVIPASGDNPNDQEKQLRAYLKEHPDAEVEGFSQGGYTLRRLKKDFPKAKFTELGTGPGGKDSRFPGVGHMKLPRAEAERAEAGKKTREAKAAPKPMPPVAKKEEPTKTASAGPVERTEHAGGTTTRATDAPKLAEGGIVNRPTEALVGEAGPEAIIPLDGGGSFGDLNLDNLLRQHADLQAHVNRNPINVPIAEPQRMGTGRQPFARMFEAARRKTEARRTAHDAPLDTGPM